MFSSSSFAGEESHKNQDSLQSKFIQMSTINDLLSYLLATENTNII